MFQKPNVVAPRAQIPNFWPQKAGQQGGNSLLAPACQISNLSAAYHDKVVLHGVNLTVHPGRILGILGPNGAGKSTLLKAALGLLPPLTGEVTFFGAPLAQMRGEVGYMPQSASVDWDFPTTVRDVVTMGTYVHLGWFRRIRAEQRQQATSAMVAVGITDLADRQIGQLSGGQRQRVFLARVLAQNPRLYLMDEPFAGVDAASEKAIMQVLRQLRSQGRAIAIVHHDLSTVRRFCDDVAILNTTVVAHGPVEEVFTSAVIERAYGLALDQADQDGKDREDHQTPQDSQDPLATQDHLAHPDGQE